MPIHTQIIREGQPFRVQSGWGWFHVECMILAATLDSGIGAEADCSEETMLGAELAAKVRADRATPIPVTRELVRRFVFLGKSPLGSGFYILKQDWTFEDESDGEIFSLLAGDELHMYR